MASLRRILLNPALLVPLLFLSCANCQGLRSKRQTETSDIRISDLVSDLGPRRQVNLVLVIDRSTGMGKERFYFREKKLMQSVLTQYATVHPDYVRVAAVTFAKHSTVDFDYIQGSDHVTKCFLFDGDDPAWRKLKYYSDPEIAHGTNIHDGLLQAEAIIDEGQRARPGATGIIILVTDGDYGSGETDPFPLAESLRNKGYKIYAVGIGSWLKPGSVRILVSEPEYYAAYEDWERMTATNLSSVPHDTELLTAEEADSVCGEGCKQHAGCYCDIDRGFSTCGCKPGYYRTNDNECIACAVGMYSDTYEAHYCKVCPYDHVTSGPGATSLQDCQCTKQTCYDLCASGNCQSNQFQCTQTNGSTYTCPCALGFSGADCLNTDSCTFHKCQNGGKCYDKVNDYACVCPWGFRGQFCEINENECLEDLCMNNSTCTDRTRWVQCDCHYGWGGIFCHEVSTTTSTSTTTTTTPTPPSTSSTPSTTSSTATTTLMISSSTSAASHSGDIGGQDATTDESNDKTSLYIIIGTCAGGGMVLLVVIIALVACLVTRRGDNQSEASSQEGVIESASEGRYEKRKKRASLYNSISHKFSGMWRKKTVRGNAPWLDDETGKKGLPSVPSRRPDVIDDTFGIDEAEQVVEYATISDQEIKVDVGMSGWQKLLTEMEDGGVLDAGIICKLNSEDRASTTHWQFSWDEISRLEILVDESETTVPAVVQGGEYVIVENKGGMASGRTIGDMQVKRTVVMGKTKNYLVVAIVSSEEDYNGRLKKEIQWLVDHIRGEGY